MSYDLILKNTKINWSRGSCYTAAPSLCPAAPSLVPAKPKTALKGAFVGADDPKINQAVNNVLAKAVRTGTMPKHDRKFIKAAARKGNQCAVRALGVLRQKSLMQGEFVGLNDDEAAVANEGGASERAALSRLRGESNEDLVQRAKSGDVLAQLALRKAKIRAAADKEEREGI